MRVAHLASHILGKVTRALSDDWERIYDHPVYFAETFIDPGRFRGACYRGANWQLLGFTGNARSSVESSGTRVTHFTTPFSAWQFRA